MKFYQKKWVKVLAVILIAIFAIWLTFSCVPRIKSVDDNTFLKAENALPMMIAHGGGNLEFPDNTFEAFANAYNTSPEIMLETDVCLSKDGIVLLTHDNSPRRKTMDYFVPVEESENAVQFEDLNYIDLINDQTTFNFQEGKPYSAKVDPLMDPFRVASYANGDVPKFTALGKDENGNYKKPQFTYQKMDGVTSGRPTYGATTLEDLLVNFPKSYINVEIKQINTEGNDIGDRCFKEVLKLLEKYDAFHRVVVATTDKTKVNPAILETNKNNKSLMFSPSDSGIIEFFILKTLGLDLFFTLPTTVMQVPMSRNVKGINVVIATESFVKTAHRHNIAVHYWTINEAKDFDTMLRIGADGIMTDLPTKLLAYLNGELTSDDYD